VVPIGVQVDSQLIEASLCVIMGYLVRLTSFNRMSGSWSQVTSSDVFFAASSAVLFTVFALSGCSNRDREDSDRVQPVPLVLQESEGEHRMRRPRPSDNPVALGGFIIKVDRKNGGSTDFFMGYEDIPAGAGIPLHHHPRSGEILFIQKGTGVASLGSRTGRVGPGSTVFIPRNTRVSLKNTGPEPLALAFIFPGEGIGNYLRATSVPEGEFAKHFSAEAMALIRRTQQQEITFDSTTGGSAGGLILQENEGEWRLRRPPPSGVTALRTPYIIKVDSRNGRSTDLFMGYEDIAPGAGIAPHHHDFADEILFIHRGSGTATVGTRKDSVGPGTTIFIPRKTRASLENTGQKPLTVGFIFPRVSIEQYFRETSVKNGERVTPFSAEEFAAIRARHKQQVTFDQP
jgi:mannose-6-phosphate isomerase-like protein (cupin superfamily)